MKKVKRNQHELELKPITTTKKKEEEENVEECGLIGHEKKKLEYFCEEDEVPVCSQCLLIGLCFFSLKHKNKHKNKHTQDHIVKEKCNTNVRQSKKQQRNRGRNFQRKEMK